MSSSNLDSANLKAKAYGGLINESVLQKIFDISKVPLPLTERIGSGTHKNERFEWTVDALSAPDVTNAKIDGQDTTSDNDTVLGDRVSNHSQICTKTVQVSSRADASDTVGRAQELSYQVMRRNQEIRRDLEAIALTGQASLADTGSAAGTTGALGAWLETNTKHGSGGSAGGFNTSTGVVDAPTGGTARGLTELLIRDVVQDVYTEGGNSTVAMSTPAIIRGISQYLFSSSARVATLYSDQGKSAEKATALGSVNVFVTDFGTLELVPNRLQQTTGIGSPVVPSATLYVLDPEYLNLSYLRGYRVEPLAKTGLAEKRTMSVDWGLCVKTEKAQGAIFDINPATTMVSGL